MKKGTWIVFGLALVLGALYFISREKEISVGIKHLKLPTFAEEKIDRIEVLGKNPVVLVKRDDKWKVKLDGEGREVPADDANVIALLDAAKSLRSSHYVTNQKEKLSELGFNDDAVTIKLLNKDKPEFVLVLGKNAAAEARYAKLTDDDDIFVVRGSFWQLTRNGAADFRNREVWPIRESDLKRFTIEKADGGKLILVKEEAGTWNFDASQSLPPNFRVDKGALQSVVRNATSLNASGFVNEPKQLSAPILKLFAEGNELEIFIDKDDKYLARRVGDEQIFEIPKHSVDRFNQPIDALRDLSVLKIDKSAIKEITVRHGKNLVVLKKEEGSWSIVEPKQLPEKFEFDPSAVDDTLSMLAGLAAERVATAKDLPISTDWQKSSLVELSFDNEKVHLYVSKSKSGKDEFLVRGNIDNNIYVVKGMRLSLLQSGINGFKKEEFNLPPIDENTKGFESLPIDIQRKLLNVTKEKKQ